MALAICPDPPTDELNKKKKNIVNYCFQKKEEIVNN